MNEKCEFCEYEGEVGVGDKDLWTFSRYYEFMNNCRMDTFVIATVCQVFDFDDKKLGDHRFICGNCRESIGVVIAKFYAPLLKRLQSLLPKK